MIKDIDNAVILNVEVYADEKNIIKEGDILVWNNIENRWELPKTGLDIVDTIFGIVCDTADNEFKRNICIEGIIETNIEEAGHPPFSLLFFYSNKNAMSFMAPTERQVNGTLLKYLPSQYGKARGLVKIWNNTNYMIYVPK